MAIKNQKTKSDFLTWTQITNLIHKLGRDNRPKFQLLIAISSLLGLRISDVLSLRWSQILEKDYISIIEMKSKKHRKMIINKDLRKIIKECYHKIKPDSDLIFTNRKGSLMSVQYINRELKKMKIDYVLEINNFSTHTFRKSFAREYWRRNNYSDQALIMISEIFSHSSVQVTKRYLGIKDEELQEAYEILTL